MNNNNNVFLQKHSLFFAATVASILLVGLLLIVQAKSVHATDTMPFVGQMQLGSQNPEVTKLQIFLAAEPAIYPAGLITGYYGPLTAEAVRQFQVLYQLPQVGRVGPLTLSAMNSVVTSGLPLDVRAPNIFHTAVQVTGTTAVIMWDTTETARGVVYYSTQPIVSNEVNRAFTQPYVSGTAVATTGASSIQSVTLQGLARSTTYYYLIEAIDASGNTNITMPSVFVTGK